MESVRQPFVVVVKGWDASLLRILILRFGESYRNDILRGLRLCEVYRRVGRAYFNQRQRLTMKHTACKPHDFGFWIIIAYCFMESEIGIIQTIRIITGRAGIVCTEVYAYDVWDISGEVPNFGGIIEKSLIIHGRHTIWTAFTWPVIISVDTYSTASYHKMLGMEVSGSDCSVGVIVIFRFFGKGIGGFNTLYSISTCDGITDNSILRCGRFGGDTKFFPLSSKKPLNSG